MNGNVKKRVDHVDEGQPPTLAQCYAHRVDSLHLEPDFCNVCLSPLNPNRTLCLIWFVDQEHPSEKARRSIDDLLYHAFVRREAT